LHPDSAGAVYTHRAFTVIEYSLFDNNQGSNIASLLARGEEGLGYVRIILSSFSAFATTGLILADSFSLKKPRSSTTILHRKVLFT